MSLPAGFSFRPATLDDADLWARLRSADPRFAYDPVIERDGWDRVTPGMLRERQVVQDGGIAIGCAAVNRWPAAEGDPFYVHVVADFLEGHESDELRDACWESLEARARELDAGVITSRCLDHQAARRAHLETRGYRLARSGIISGLEIGAEPERFLEMARAADARMAAADIELTTLDRVDDRRREVYEVMVESESDIPSSAPIAHESFEQFSESVAKPWVGKQRVWVALQAGRPIGLSWLAYHPTTGNVFTEMTGVARAARGRGVAAALKLKTLEQALAAGVSTVLTQNDADNAPILKINRAFGYRPLREQLEYAKPA